MGTTKRIVLQFDECVYAGENKLWFLLDYELAPTINDILFDLTNKLNFDYRSSNIYVNGVIVPHWVSSHVLFSSDDIIKVTQSASAAVLPTLNLEVEPSLSVKNSIIPESTLNKDLRDSISVKKSDIPEPIMREDLNNSVSVNSISIPEPAKKDAEESCHKNTPGSSADDEMEVNDPSNNTQENNSNNPYLTNASLKINNNFKRHKMPNTTPTHRDRYTNRSKIYVSPGNVKKSEGCHIPVVSALQTAMKETLAYSSKPSLSLKRAIDKTKKQNGHQGKPIIPPACLTTDSINKSKLFQDRVSSLISCNASVKKIESSSEDSSMTSTSSDDEAFQQPNKIQKINKKEDTSSDDSDDDNSDDDDDESKTKCKPSAQTVPATTKKQSSIEEDSFEEPDAAKREKTSSRTSVSPISISGQIVKNPQPSSTEDESDDETSIVKPPANSSEKGESDDDDDSDTEKTVLTDSVKNKDSKKEESEEDSSNESVKENTSCKTNNIKTEESSDDSADSEDEKQPVKEDPIKAAEKAKKDYSVYVALQGTPRVSDKLAFKMLDLNQSYCPVISEYKEGIITQYNSTSQLITVKLFPQFVTLQQPEGRFQMEDANRADDQIQLNLKQLIEPKLLSSTVT